MSNLGAKKPRGRPKSNTEAVNVRVDRAVLDALTVRGWDRLQPLSRPETIRRVLADYLVDYHRLEAPPPSADLALNYFKSANGHLIAAQRLYSGGIERNSSLQLAFHNIIGFAWELYLKSYLALKGVPYHDLVSRANGHNLIALYEKACDLGFAKIDRPRNVKKEAFDRMTELLHDNHSAFSYRYPKSDIEIKLFQDDAAVTDVLEIIGRTNEMLRSVEISRTA